MDSRLQMTWQPNRRSRRRSALSPPLGLRNLGNTCYLNSVLQCLTYTPPLGNFSLNSQHSSNCSFFPNCAFCIVEKRIHRNLSSDLSVDAPIKIHNCIGLFAEHFKCYQQEDAHEFLRFLIDACHGSCLKNDKIRGGDGNGDGDSVVKEIFGGELRSQVKCVSCGGESNKIDEIMDVSLDLFEVNSVKEALQRFFEPEVLNGANKYKCETCDKLVVAKKQMSIQKAPNVLVIQLKRFEGIHARKIDRAISFSECLVLSNYMCKESQDPHPEYNLIGTIVHSGYSLDSGHYYAYVKDTVGRWYCCNDSIVSLTNLQEVLSEKVYVLFFIRTNQRPRPAKSSSVANGVKPHSNGHDAQKAKEALPNSVATRPHGPQNSERIIPITSKAGIPSLDPRNKCDDLGFSDFKELHENGNGIGNGNAENHISLKEGKDREKIMEARSLINNIDVASANESATAVEPESEQNILLPHENGKTVGGSVKPMQTGRPEDAGLGHIVVNGRISNSILASQDEKSSTISGSKRKILDDGTVSCPSPDANQETYEDIREKLIKDASSHLRSCGWYEDVRGFMRAKKKDYAQSSGNTTNNIELRKVMIEEARQNFNSQVPAALKANLVSCLHSLHQKKQS